MPKISDIPKFPHRRDKFAKVRSLWSLSSYKKWNKTKNIGKNTKNYQIGRPNQIENLELYDFALLHNSA